MAFLLSVSWKAIIVGSLGIAFPLTSDSIKELPSHQLLGHQDSVTSVAFNPATGDLATGSSDKSIRIWRVGTSASARTIPTLSQVHAVAFSPDGKTMVCAEESGVIEAFEFENGKKVGNMDGGEVTPSVSAVYSPNGKNIATGSSSGRIRFWDASTFQLTANWNADCGEVDAISFSSDGSLVAAGGSGKGIRVWNCETKALVKALRTPDYVFGASFAPDQQSIALGGYRCGTGYGRH